MKFLDRPNVLLLYTDQQRLDSMGCYGNILAITPNLDKLAESGAKFNKCFVQSPVCTPSRVSMLTSRYCSSTGVGHNGTPFSEERLTPVNKILNDYGYHTAQIGKLHFDPHAKRNHKNPTSNYGFRTFILSDEPGCYDDAYIKWVENIDKNMVKGSRTSLPPAALFYNQTNYSDVERETHQPYLFEADEEFTHSSFVASETCKFIKKHKNDTFFAISGFYAPHTPVNPPKRFVDMYNQSQMPLPILSDEEKMDDKLKDITSEEWQKIKAYYMALVTHVDDCIGYILNTLEEENLLENTIIIFTSDHGEFLGDHGRIQKGPPGQDCITNVPLLVSYKNHISENIEFDQLVESVDIVPTILDYCGVQIPNYMQGKSLSNLIKGEETKHKDVVMCELFSPNGERSLMIRNKEYKYFMSDTEEILFDLIKDKNEGINFIKDKNYSNVLSSLRKEALKCIMKANYNGDEKIAEY